MIEKETSISIEVDELKDKLEAIQEDGFITAELTLENDGFSKQLRIETTRLEDDSRIDYGAIEEQELSSLVW